MTYPCVDGAFCRFVGHVRDVNYQNMTRNDRQMKLVGTLVSYVRKEKHGESEGMKEEETEMNRRVKITKVVKK